MKYYSNFKSEPGKQNKLPNLIKITKYIQTKLFIIKIHHGMKLAKNNEMSLNIIKFFTTLLLELLRIKLSKHEPAKYKKSPKCAECHQISL